MLKRLQKTSFTRFFYATHPADVFSAPKASVTGALTTTIQELDPHASYYVGVRAEDESGNRETNTQILVSDPELSANRAWVLYE